jgi:hypothetical protein
LEKMTLSILLLIAVTIVLVLAIPVMKNLTQEVQGQTLEETLSNAEKNIEKMLTSDPVILEPCGGSLCTVCVWKYSMKVTTQ